MTRVQRAIQYGLDNQAAWTPSARAEFAILCEIAGYQNESLVDVILDMLGEPYDGQFADGNSSQRWIHSLLTGDPLPELVVGNQTGYELTHLVYDSTNIARSAISNSTAANRILATLNDEDNIDLVGEYLIALHGLGTALPAGKLLLIGDLLDGDYGDFDNYHPLFVGAILEGLRT